jgi:phage shock protein C
MLCSNCQKEIVDASKFCYNCGANLAGAAGAALPPPVPPIKRLVRSSTDKKIGGVCAGLANYFDLDPTIVRVIWFLAVFFGGTGLLVYIIMWIVLPVGPTNPYVTVPAPPARV